MTHCNSSASILLHLQMRFPASPSKDDHNSAGAAQKSKKSKVLVREEEQHIGESVSWDISCQIRSSKLAVIDCILDCF